MRFMRYLLFEGGAAVERLTHRLLVQPTDLETE